MRKIILVPALLVFISSCTLPFSGKIKDESFIGLYNANIHSTIASYEKMSTSLGFNRHETIDGTIRSSVSVPDIFSGSLSSEYTGLIDGGNSASFLKNIKILFTSLVSTGSLSADEIGLISHSTDGFVSYKNINDVGLIPEQYKAIIKKYENTWMNISKNAVSDMSKDELLGYTITKNLLTKSLGDIEKYATDFPIWKNTADLGMSGSIHMWSIELDRSNILALAKKLTQDLSGTGMSDEYTKNIETSLATVSFSGKLGFDPKNPKFSIIDGIISSSGKLVAEITISRNENNGSITIDNSEEKTNIVINYGKIDSKYSFDGSIRKDGKEMGKINAYLQNKDEKFQELAVEASVQGMTVSLKHTMNGDKFVGKLSAIVGTVDWSGMISDGRLTGLKIDGASPLGSFSTDLVKKDSDTMIRGPLVVKSGEEILVSANLGLEIVREKFAFVIDVLSEQFPVHFDLMLSGKSTPSNKAVSLPNSTKSFEDFMNEIQLLLPPVLDLPTMDRNSEYLDKDPEPLYENIESELN